MATRRRGGRTQKRGALSTDRWQDDPHIMARLRIVESLWDQPLNRTLAAVNEAMRARGFPEVKMVTLAEDRRRVIAIARERILQPGKHSLIEHTMSLMSMMQQAQRDALSMPPGPARAPLYAIALRCREDLMRIDGTWTRGAMGFIEEEEDQVEERFAPDPDALLEAGIVTQQDVLAHLRVLAARGKKQARLIEGQATDVTPAQNLAPRPGTANTGVTVERPARRPTVKVPTHQAPPPDLPPPHLPNPEAGALEEYAPSPWE